LSWRLLDSDKLVFWDRWDPVKLSFFFVAGVLYWRNWGVGMVLGARWNGLSAVLGRRSGRWLTPLDGRSSYPVSGLVL